MSEDNSGSLDITAFCPGGVWSSDFTAVVPIKDFPGKFPNNSPGAKILHPLLRHAEEAQNAGAGPGPNQSAEGQVWPGKPDHSVDETVTIRAPLSPLPEQTGGADPDLLESECRINACHCDRGTVISLTARVTGDVRIKEERKPKGPLPELSPYSPKSEGFPLPTRYVVESLWDLLLTSPKQAAAVQGLVVFAGGTGSGKSVTAQAFCLRHILALRLAPGIDRPPHLVSVEDPIEGWKGYVLKEGEMVKVPLSARNAPEYQFNLTAREVGKDVVSLRRAVADAKRQTPKCLYVGEVRAEKDWSEVVDFAGSGHLVVVTTHAGSLTETLGRVLYAVKARTPASRGWVARRILACVHLAATTPESGEGRLVVPAVWRGNVAQAVNDLIADGLGSVVPNGEYVLSRRQFVDRVRNHFEEKLTDLQKKHEELKKRNEELQKARRDGVKIADDEVNRVALDLGTAKDDLEKARKDLEKAKNDPGQVRKSAMKMDMGEK